MLTLNSTSTFKLTQRQATPNSNGKLHLKQMSSNCKQLNFLPSKKLHASLLNMLT